MNQRKMSETTRGYPMGEPNSDGSRARLRDVFQSLIWPRRHLLLLSLVIIGLNRAAGMVFPWSTKVLLDDIAVNRDADQLRWLLIVVSIAVVVQAASSFSLTLLLSVEAQRLIATMRSSIMRHVLTLPTSFFDRSKSGSLVSRIMEDVTGVRNLIGTGFVQLVGGVFTAIVVLFILMRISAVMTAVVLGPMIVLALITAKAFQFIRPIFRDRSRIRADVTGRLTETLGGVRIVKGFHAEAREGEVFDQGVHRIFDNIKKTLTASSFVQSAATFLVGMVIVLIMGIGGRMILQGELTTGEFISFTLYLMVLVMPIVQMTSVGSQLTEALAGLDRVEALLAETSEGVEAERTVTIDDFHGNLHFEEVSFAYEPGVEVVKGVSFDAPRGSVTALVGSSGSGKSTLAGLAASYLKPTKGRILVDGVDLSTLRLGDYRQHLGVVLQDDFLFEGTIRENLLFVRPDATEEQISAAVTGAYVNEFVDRLEDGLETVIGERGIKLSGGQRQRVSIARALLADPQILFLDEATSNLDTESERLIQESLETLMRGRTTIVIAHRLSTIRKANQILVLEGGSIVERGTHDDLIAREGRYHRLYTYEARI